MINRKDEQEKFERWFELHYGHAPARISGGISPFPRDDYVPHAVGYMWEGWLARAQNKGE